MSRRPRIRSIKPEAWQDERLGGVSRDARLLWVALITLADDDGRFRALPALILGHGFPFDKDAPKKLDGWLAELDHAGLIRLYTVGQHAYGVFPTWAQNQRISKPTPSVLPAPPAPLRVVEEVRNAA
ncbi:MAG: uncharacterized protein JWM31_1357 [Solirubrobacterales bacterium]|nr:uncharacterized protein [Solirubrobacterales bacterium]